MNECNKLYSKYDGYDVKCPLTVPMMFVYVPHCGVVPFQPDPSPRQVMTLSPVSVNPGSHVNTVTKPSPDTAAVPLPGAPTLSHTETQW